MVIGIELKNNIKEMTKKLDSFQRTQIPYATSRALNDTAKDVQDAEIKNVQLKFKNRKKWYAKGNPRTGFRLEFSRKDNLVASVFSNAEFLKLQEEGGIKTPKNGFDTIDIPKTKVPKRYQKRGGARKMEQSSKNVIKKGDAVYRKRGKKLEKLFSLVKQIRVKPRLKFHKVAEVATKRKFDRNFKKWLEKAIASSKLK